MIFMKILIIEDNEKLALSLRKGLEQEGFAVDLIFDGLSGERQLDLHADVYDAVVLDIMLPQKDGLSVCADLRKKQIFVPILMLTAKDTVSDKVVGLNSGADDYLVKPFSIDELIARLHALARRDKAVYAPEISRGNIRLNPRTHRVFRSEKEIKLTHKEFSILEYFLKNPERVLTRQNILDHVWDYDFTTFSNLVDVKIKNLRKKIDPKGEIIETVRNVGYRLKK